MELFEFNETEYFNLTEERKLQLGKNVLNEIRRNRKLISPELVDIVLIPVLNKEIKKAEEQENYMMCDAITYIIKAFENEERM